MTASLSQTSAQRHKESRLPYQYRALDRPGKQIRLLEVLPGSKEEPLRARFISKFLSDDYSVAYETISYAWGDPTQRYEIEIDDETVIDIPASSGAAIRCMRRPNTSRRLWIDAVCINQDDNQERSFQVKMMGEIYRRSSHNLVYLGEEDASTRSAVASIRRLLEQLNERLGPSESFTELARRGEPPPQCELDVPAIYHLFERPWFTRMWVVQEVILAPISTCYCGIEICISLLSIVRASTYIYNFFPMDELVIDGSHKISLSLLKCAKLQPLVDPKERFYVGLKEDGSSTLGKLKLFELIWLGTDRLCTDPRDRIFSIVGVIEQARAETSREDGADLALLEVDYGKCLQEVLRDATRFCIQESRNLKVWNDNLVHLNSSVQNGDILLDGFCSWVPRLDFRQSGEGEIHPFILPKASAGLPVSSETAIATPVDPNILTLAGYAIADVVEVSQSLKRDLFSHEARLADTLTSIHRMCSGVIHPDPTKANEFPDCLARALTASPYQEVDPHKRKHVFVSLQKHLCDVFNSDKKNKESEYWSDSAELMFISICSDRRVFTCSNGYIGQGPSCLRAGDRIVVLLGGNVPYAVRLQPGGDGDSGQLYHLLGSAYVEGAMYGECVEAARARGEEPSTFHFV